MSRRGIKSHFDHNSPGFEPSPDILPALCGLSVCRRGTERSTPSPDDDLVAVRGDAVATVVRALARAIRFRAEIVGQPPTTTRCSSLVSTQLAPAVTGVCGILIIYRLVVDYMRVCMVITGVLLR